MISPLNLLNLSDIDEVCIGMNDHGMAETRESVNTSLSRMTRKHSSESRDSGTTTWNGRWRRKLKMSWMFLDHIFAEEAKIQAQTCIRNRFQMFRFPWDLKRLLDAFDFFFNPLYILLSKTPDFD